METTTECGCSGPVRETAFAVPWLAPSSPKVAGCGRRGLSRCMCGEDSGGSIAKCASLDGQACGVGGGCYGVSVLGLHMAACVFPEAHHCGSQRSESSRIHS